MRPYHDKVVEAISRRGRRFRRASSPAAKLIASAARRAATAGGAAHKNRVRVTLAALLFDVDLATRMTRNELDHIVVVAGAREAGTAWVEESLGVPLQAGGEHERMGTHNALLRLGEKQYLEVISVNPMAPAPNRPRWFELDRLMPDSAPRLATWVARTADIGVAVAACPPPPLEILAMSRGVLSWLIAIPADGSLLGGGILPALIEWPADVHPLAGLTDHGCALTRLEGFHPDAGRLALSLDAIGLGEAIELRALPEGGRPYLVAHFETPHGPRTIGGPRA